VVPLAAALGALLFTRARWMGDTVDYAQSALSFDRHAWDFGHLLWVPLGWLAHTLGRLNTTGLAWTLILISTVSGVVSVLLLRVTLGLVGVRPWPAAAVSVAFLFSQAMLNYMQTGASYVPGLAMTLLALFLALLRPHSIPGAWACALGSGCALAGAVLLWFPYILAAPGVLLAPVLLRGFSRSRGLFVLKAGTAMTLLLLATYGPVGWAMGVRDPAGLKEWVAKSAHGVRTAGAARMIFGLARSFIFMGDDGLAFKRHLLRDPFHPVPVAELIGSSLWKLALFYLALAAIALRLLGDAVGRRLALLALVGGLPVLAFGLCWQGGDMERYLPLYPVFFLTLAGAWEAPGGWRGLRWLAAGFFVVAIGINGHAFARYQVQAYQDALADRVRDLRPVLKPGSTLVVVRDRLNLLPRDFPLDVAGRDLHVYEAAMPGLATTDRWRADFAAMALKTWSLGGEVWLSKRLLEPRPRSDSTWVEGEDSRLRWADVPAFFGMLEYDRERCGADGFLRLGDDPDQRERLRAAALPDVRGP
jgi:hypothetical protein